MIWQIIIMAMVGGVIGWFTNYLAIKLIFRPLNPLRIPLLGVEIQGLIPKRRQDIAISIGKTVEEELLSMEEMLKHLNSRQNQTVILGGIRTRIIKAVGEKIPAIVPRGIKGAILKYTDEIITRESKDFLNNSMEEILRKVTEQVSVSALVEEKINDFDLIELETIILSLSHSELKYIEILGGVLGLLIGLIQGLIMVFFM